MPILNNPSDISLPPVQDVNVVSWHGVNVPPLAAGLPADVREWGGDAVAGLSAAGRVKVDVEGWNGATVPAPAGAGIPSVDVLRWRGAAVAGPVTAGVPTVDTQYWRGGKIPAQHVTGVPDVNVEYTGGKIVPASYKVTEIISRTVDIDIQGANTNWQTWMGPTEENARLFIACGFADAVPNSGRDFSLYGAVRLSTETTDVTPLIPKSRSNVEIDQALGDGLVFVPFHGLSIVVPTGASLQGFIASVPVATGWTIQQDFLIVGEIGSAVPLEERTIPELRELAAQWGVPLSSRMRKPAIIAALSEGT